MPAANGDADAESGPRHTIGELLRETRQSYGGDIDRIAETLRIRAAYLKAIEESQYDRLPGPVYAQGFVRAYAVHLGLDGDEAIRRFKQEVAGFEVSRDLSFPVPLAERSIPGGTMVLAALILAICGYGLWYYVSTSDRSHPERVSAVPPDLVAAAQKPAPSSDSASAMGPTTPPATAVTATTEPLATTPSAETTPPSTAAAPSPTAAASVTPPSAVAAPLATGTPAASPAISAPTVAAPAVAPARTASQPTAPPASAPPQTAATTPTTAPAQAASAPAAAPAPPSGDTSATSPVPQPRVYGAQPDVPVRIIVHAIKDSWVQLRNGEDVLVQRTLHPGDSVRVPDEGGLSLRTGNGAGIQLEIDGKLGKPLSGTVRTVPLDADRLAASGGNLPRPPAE